MSISAVGNNSSYTYAAGNTSYSNSSSGKVTSHLEYLTENDKATLYAATGATVVDGQVVGGNEKTQQLFSEIADQRYSSQVSGVLTGNLTTKFAQDLASGKYSTSENLNQSDVTNLINVLNGNSSSGRKDYIDIYA